MQVPFWSVQVTPDSAKATVFPSTLELPLQGYGGESVLRVPILTTNGGVDAGTELVRFNSADTVRSQRTEDTSASSSHVEAAGKGNRGGRGKCGRSGSTEAGRKASGKGKKQRRS